MFESIFIQKFVKIFHLRVAKCAQYHYYENVLREMSKTNFGGKRNEKTF